MPQFNRMELKNWRQFRRINLDLSRNCVILTGVNGSGKTTILNILSKHFGWNIHFISTPLIGKRRISKVYSDVYDENTFFESDEIPREKVQVGTIWYDGDQHCNLTTDPIVGANYHLNYNGIQRVEGLYIPSHRPAASFAPVSKIPTEPIEITQMYQEYFNVLSQSVLGARIQNPALQQKESIIALAVFGETSEHVDANPAYAGLLNRFEEILRIGLPKDLGFQNLRIRTPDIVLETSTGSFSLDSMSGGVNALFGILWQVFTFGVNKDRYVVIIDEPENHLHPSMQRAFLPSLVAAFPNVRFVVSTHSPFVVSSYEGAAVVSLQRNGDGKIVSEELEGADLSASPNAVLRDILRVESTLPIWVENEIRGILAATKDLSPEERGDAVMNSLERLGIADAVTEFSGNSE